MMEARRRLTYALITATAAVLGLLLVRTASSYVPSLSFEFFANRLTYVYLFVSTAIIFLAIGYVLGRRIDELRRLSLTDPLTGLANQRAFHSRLRAEWERARRYPSPLSLLLIDVDGLKRINDTYGHAAGNDVLKAAGQAIGATMRTTDSGARWGGDEFAIVAPNTASDSAQHLAGRLLDHVSKQAAARRGNVTVSVGVATLEPRNEPSMNAESLLQSADAALYRAKKEGRNRVKVA